MDRVKDPQIVAVAAAASRRWGFPRSRRVRGALVLGALALLAVGAYWSWQAWPGGADARAKYATATVQRGDIEDAVTATGTLQPRDYVDVGTQVSGQIKKLYVEVGSTVKAGQLLAEIDATVYTTKVDADRAQLLNQQAQLADRQAQLQLAEQQFQRQTNMMREDATTAEAVQSAEAALRSAKAQVDVINAQLQQTSSTLRGDEANLGYTKIYAPMSGTVVAQSAKLGQTLNANQQAPIIVRIADLSTMTVQSQVSEADVSRLAVGMDVYFKTLGNPDKRWYGKLRQINPTPEIVNNVVLYNALFDVGNPGGALMTQMTAQIFFVTASASGALIVPAAALQSPSRGDGTRASNKAGQTALGATPRRGPPSADAQPRQSQKQAMVRLLHDDGSIEQRAVKVGVVTRVAAQVTEGLQEGDQVVIGERTTSPAPVAPATAKSGNAIPRTRPQI